MLFAAREKISDFCVGTPRIFNVIARRVFVTATPLSSSTTATMEKAEVATTTPMSTY